MLQALGGPGPASRHAEPMRAPIALDAMGGDLAPDALVAGALRAAEEDGLDVVLVGQPEALSAALGRAGREGGLRIVGASDVVGMDEDPALALRAKPGSSIRVAAGLVAQGRAAGLVSAGSTGATLAAALLALGRLPGVRRPAVAAAIPLPTLEPTPAVPPAGVPIRQVVLLDAGASADVQPELLPSYAWMGTAYAQLLGSPAPRVGLLNMAAEAGKGNELARAAFPLLSGVPGFVGNVEPAAVLGGAVDVVVTDGFTGNVFLKTVEALRPAPGERARSWSEAAAGVLLGVAGEVLVAHGSADAAEIRAALRAARRAVTAGLSTAVAALLGAGSPVGIA